MTRKVDALVHEHIFERPVERTETGHLLKADYSAGVDGIDLHVALFWRGAAEVPDYSTDIAAAWRVVEKLHLDYRVSFILERNEEHPNKKGLWQAILVMPKESKGYHAQEKTAPYAICLAALRARGIGEDEINEATKERVDDAKH